MEVMRDVIFIGHANPEDNEFALWLQAKLINEGYKAECDLSYLTGGEEDYWKTLQELLENNSAKYLLILSKKTFTKQGVIDEWEQVKIIAKRHQLNDFIYVLKIDDVPFDVRIGVPTKNHFRFDVSWAKGLKQLFLKLHKDQVVKNQNVPLSIEAWIKNRFSTSHGVIERKESYYSNWLQINDLPGEIYFFKYATTSQAEVIEKSISTFPVIRHDDYIITFSEELPSQIGGYDFDIPYKNRLDVSAKKALDRYDSSEFPKHEDLRRFLVRLLKEAWTQYIVQRGLHLYELSSNTKCFFYLKDQLPKDKVFFTYKGKSTYKQLVGEYGEQFWHYGISCTALLNPILCFSLRAHLVFSDHGAEIWASKSKLHRARRSKGKSFFNKEWRSLMLAFLSGLSDNQKEIRLPISEKRELVLSIEPVRFASKYGYEEPKTDGRIVPVDFFDEMIEEEELSDFEELSEQLTEGEAGKDGN
jgi:hypothetical protein